MKRSRNKIGAGPLVTERPGPDLSPHPPTPHEVFPALDRRESSAKFIQIQLLTDRYADDARDLKKSMARTERKLITGAFAVLFIGAVTALSAVPVEAQEPAGCRNALNDLYVRGAVQDAKVIVDNCPDMVRKAASDVPKCVAAWNALTSKKALTSVRFVITHNCSIED